MKSVNIRDIGEQYSWGSFIDGVTWDNINDPGLRAELQQLFEDRGLLIFENMEPSPKMQVELSKVFGPLKDHPTKSVPRANKDLEPGVIELHSLPTELDETLHGIAVVNGKPVVSYLPWHFDHTYNDELNRAGVLRAVIQAPEGGRTGFADGIELYNAFDPELLAKIEDLNAIYTLDTRLTQMRFGRTFEINGDPAYMAGVVAEARRFPRAIHPMVWTRTSGEKVLHVTGFSAEGIENHENPEGDALMEEVCQEVNRKANGYFHNWRPTDMVIWDNWRLLHAVEGCHPKYERCMHRTTIKGDYGLGRFENGKKIGEVDRDIAPLDLPA
ncbi:TauD/TfdA dioxygenase family protein [Novosphingobium album (ex Hu et al. 2023)]|uniref:TauD/TfdA family dioxygenase n=1 Tax=Novosphingobium album (ex Hu et al. 2023) TaxID=2930093 RepID=A0ABT0B575_9SPHN|nr:TauD/TfdA family dioxygenase [Novosphingobium album (ex Hu et al. 2023)]MCJ2180216.1 TauD/TfdA family dioxygenase [Novosphingobium album (ex Hu et al. 2023)]